jgi:methylase of polypeptide subunit release factors
MNKKSPRGIDDTQTLINHTLQRVIQEGDIVVDATAGRGKDTVFLAQCVGQAGKVYAFDIQEEAIRATKDLLQERGLFDRVLLLQKNHSEMGPLIPDQVKAIVFNLGYLPGSNKQIVTRAETTIEAVRQGLDRLTHRGILALTVYRGHEGGLDESQKLTNYLSLLPKKDFSVIQGIYLNQGEQSPFWIMIQKNREDNR